MKRITAFSATTRTRRGIWAMPASPDGKCDPAEGEAGRVPPSSASAKGRVSIPMEGESLFCSHAVIAPSHTPASAPRRSHMRTVLIGFTLLGLTSPAWAEARALPESFADLADKLVPAVVNISTTQALPDKTGEKDPAEAPELPPGSPFDDFFRDFFNKRGGRTWSTTPPPSVPPPRTPLTPRALAPLLHKN